MQNIEKRRYSDHKNYMNISQQSTARSVAFCFWGFGTSFEWHFMPIRSLLVDWPIRPSWIMMPTELCEQLGFRWRLLWGWKLSWWRCLSLQLEWSGCHKSSWWSLSTSSYSIAAWWWTISDTVRVEHCFWDPKSSSSWARQNRYGELYC